MPFLAIQQVFSPVDCGVYIEFYRCSEEDMDLYRCSAVRRVELKRWTMSRSDVGAFENLPIASVAAKIEFIVELLVDRLPLKLNYEGLKTRVNRQDGCLDRTADLQSRKVIN